MTGGGKTTLLGGRSSWFGWAGPAAIAMALSGCAVLQVDVDVYKGPLSNHRAVLTEQLAVMAVGAEPLLKRICRNAANKKLFPTASLWHVKNSDCEDGQKSDKIYQNTFDESYHEYLEIKAILDLYNDIEVDPVIKRHDEMGRSIFKTIRAMRADLWPNLLEMASENSIGEKGIYWKTILWGPPEKNGNEIARRGEIKAYHAAYKDLLHHLLRAHIELDEAELKGGEKIRLRRQITAVLAELIHVRNFWAATLAFSKKGVGDSKQHTGYIIRELDAAHNGELPLESELIRILKSENLDVVSNNWEWSPEKVKVAKRLLTTALLRYPEDMSIAILGLDEIVVESFAVPSFTLPGLDCKKAKNKDIFRFCIRHKDRPRGVRKSHDYWHAGIVRFPIAPEGKDTIAMTQLATIGNSAVAAFQGAGLLSAGRFPEGLNTLITQFVNASKNELLEKEREEKLDRLITSLIHFAEKVRTLTNMSIILDKYNKHKVALTTENKKERAERKRAKRERAFLQAMSNTMLVLAHDLISYDEHAQAQEDGFERELWAQNLVLARDAVEIYKILLKGIVEDEVRFRVAALNLTAVRDARKATVKQTCAEAEVDETVCTNRDIDAHQREADKLFNSRQTDSDDKTKTANSYKTAFKVLSDHKKEISTYLDNLTTDLTDKAKFIGELRSWIAKEITDLTDKESLALSEFLAGLDLERLFNDPIVIETPYKSTAFEAFLSFLKVGRTRAQNSLDEAQEQLEKAKDYRDAARDLNAADKELIEAQKEKTKYENAVKVLENLKPTATAVTWSSGELGPNKVFEALLYEIERLGEKSNILCEDKSKIDKLCHALSVLRNERTASLKAKIITEDIIIDRPDGKTRRAVLDTFIAQLEYQYLQAVQESGEGKGNAPRLADALKAAYEYRGGMAYLRPAGTYLRTSLAASTLQPSSGAAKWRNFLGDQMMTSIPFLGEWITNKRRYPNAKVNSKLDSQFWQLINQVRLSGGGKTNMVLAKDDIGNWYAKAYSADPKPIIEAAKSLALFAAGNKLGADLLNETEPGKSPADTSALGRLNKKYQEAYVKATNDTHTKLLALLKDKSLLTALGSDVTDRGDLEKILKDAAEELKKSTEAKNKPRKPEDKIDQGQAIITALYKVEKFRKAGEARAVAAKQSFNDQVKAQISEILGQRERAIEEYENALTFIGEAAE